MKPLHTCNRCNSIVSKRKELISDEEYFAYCPHHDEDLYLIECSESQEKNIKFIVWPSMLDSDSDDTYLYDITDRDENNILRGYEFISDSQLITDIKNHFKYSGNLLLNEIDWCI